MTTKARRTDPATSKAAGAAIDSNADKLRASQARVLAMFKLYGDMHDKQLLTNLHDAEKAAGLKPMSPSGVRSRRSELSKPNMDRLDRLAVEMHGHPLFAICLPSDREVLRERLRSEGFRSPLWDTGVRVIVDGRHVIVWGLAR
jgi:hypothetical protein